MINITERVLLACAAAAFLGACQPKSAVIDFNKINADRKSEAAEKLLYASGFMHAYHQFDEALKLNPNDPVAKFYKATLTPLMLTKGLVTRTSGLVPQITDADLVQYKQFIKNDIPAGDYTTFVLDGKADINNEKDVQAYVRSLQDAFRNMRQVYFDLSKQHLVLRVSTPKVGYSYADLANKCKVSRIGLNAYSVETCDIKETKNVELSYADFEALRLMSATAIVFLSAGTSYDLTGLINVLNTLKPKEHKHISDARIAAAVSKEQQLGKLVDVSVLKEVLGFGAEGVEATRLAYARQQELCPAGVQTQTNRPGKLFVEGFCVTGADVHQTLAMLQTGLNGIVVVPFGGEPQAYQASLDATKPFNGSITDLKTQMPTTFDACGNATSIPDNSLGGLFTNNDATQAIRHNNGDFLNKVCR